MEQAYSDNWKKAFNSVQKPVQEMMELNVKTLQSFSYIKPEDLSKLRKPEEILEKNVNIFIENGHKTLNYMQQAFTIFEKHMFSLSNNVREKTEQAMEQTRSTMREGMKNTPFSQRK